MNRTQIIGNFADKIGVSDERFEDWREAHVSQDYIAFDGLHVLCDTRYNKVAVYKQDPDGSCRFVWANFQPRK